MNKLLKILVLPFVVLYASNVFAQGKLSVQVKTFDQNLKPLPDVDVSVNGGDFFHIGPRGVGFADLPALELPPKSIAVRNESLEAASWNYSKGVLEIVIRKKNYRLYSIRLQNRRGENIKNAKVTYFGKDTLQLNTNESGVFEIPVGIADPQPSSKQFNVVGFDVTGLNLSERDNILMVAAAKKAVVSEDAGVADQRRYFKDFDLRNLDSIRSLTVFYAIFKNYQFSNLDEATRSRIDRKLNSLMSQMMDTVSGRSDRFISRISDSTFVSEDIRNLLSQAENEQRTLNDLRQEFDSKIEILNRKLEGGWANLDESVRGQLWTDIERLEWVLKENETRFYRNQSDYHRVLNSMKEKFFDVKDLENRLYVSEAQRIQERERFQRNTMVIVMVALVFVALSVTLIYFGNKLKKKQGELLRANAEVQRINENLETLVHQRTALLEKANSEMDVFLYKASHDLQGPICSIIGLCNIASRTVNSDSLELIERTHNTAFKMEKMLKKLKLISEINRPAEASLVLLHDEFKLVEEMFRQQVRANNVNFTIDCDPSVGAYTHRDLIHIVLTNVVENAVHFSALKENQVPEVKVKAVAQNNSLQISVIDNGIGIPEEIRERIWDMFFIGNDRSAGNGLGLYIVRKSIQAMNGYISLESQEDRYTRIVIVIPATISKVSPKTETLALTS